MQPRTPLAALVTDVLARNRAARAAGPRRIVELAEVLGCDPGTLHAALRGRRRLLRSSDAYVTGETLARALGLEVDQVMEAAESTP